MGMDLIMALHLEMKPHVGCLTGGSQSSKAIASAINAARLHGSAQLFCADSTESGRRDYTREAEAVIKTMQLTEDEFVVKVAAIEDVVRIDITCKK